MGVDLPAGKRYTGSVKNQRASLPELMGEFFKKLDEYMSVLPVAASKDAPIALELSLSLELLRAEIAALRKEETKNGK